LPGEQKKTEGNPITQMGDLSITLRTDWNEWLTAEGCSCSPSRRF